MISKWVKKFKEQCHTNNSRDKEKHKKKEPVAYAKSKIIGILKKGNNRGWN